MYPTEDILKTTGLFWQYPVITEKAFYEQNKLNPRYLGIPWATIVDKRITRNSIARVLLSYKKHNTYFTCCQHIHFRDLIPLFKILGISTVYTPHAIHEEHSISGITIVPCPLYAVNVEDSSRNEQFKACRDFASTQRDILYSFVGGYQPQNYLTCVRQEIFDMNHPENAYIRNTGIWHFDNDVYSRNQNKEGSLINTPESCDKTQHYNSILLRSRYSLCPSGSGPNSIRFWESLAVGAIPVLLADTLRLPYHPKWDDAILRIRETNVSSIPETLSSITQEEEENRRKTCIEIYNDLREHYNGCKHTVIHYCCGSYDIGDFGGVARYDYHISLAFPHRIFVKGPQQKKILHTLVRNVNNPIVITDNHLACDVPNDIQTILVHHGCALTHAEREPNWNKYWRDLCCNGQANMLKYRSPEKTHIVSISTFCTEEFARHFPSLYPRFKNTLMLHTSELDQKSYKTTFNRKPIVFGNWKGFIKGENLIPSLCSSTNDFVFEPLAVHYSPKIHKSFNDYNKAKQQFYTNRDIFLQLSVCEGNSFATLDAFLCGNVIVATDVGLTFADVPDDCYIKLDYKRIHDTNYIITKLKEAWENKETLAENARKFFLTHCSMDKWKKQMTTLVNVLQ